LNRLESANKPYIKDVALDELSVMSGAEIGLIYKDEEKTYTFFSSDSIRRNLTNK